MKLDKTFLTYNQQMKKLRDDKKIDCHNTPDKTLLVKSGYFNLVNGYKEPFICGTDINGHHIYIPNTSIKSLYELKKFDDNLRMLLLKYITHIEEELRTLTGYKFDQCNDNGKIPWYDTQAYSSAKKMQYKMNTISSAYSELNRSHSDYVKFYMNHHDTIPTWIMIKVINFSTFINLLSNSKVEITHSICHLYHMLDSNGYYNVKLLIGSIHWLRKVRNSCAHNERIYTITQTVSHRNKSGGRIFEGYFHNLRSSYSRDNEKKIMDLLIYFKYYLSDSNFKIIINELHHMLLSLQSSIPTNAFENIRSCMGIKDLDDLISLQLMPKEPIMYHKFDSY